MNTTLRLALGLTTSLVWLACVTGCNKHPGIVPVSGTVTIDGQPVPAGQVSVSAEGQRAAVGKIGPDGRFTLSSFELNDGAPTGTHPVTVSAVEGVTEQSNRWHAPKKYANSVTSGLQVTIDGPTDNLEIKLTWEGSGHDGPFVDKFN